uniref:A-kinase anchor protein 14-like n=1 Tax=Osmia lignaria TaxID=473952 RepID=UPI001478BF91|nr:A-kinase anchor protein 14-like [Osmia lignaria]
MMSTILSSLFFIMSAITYISSSRSVFNIRPERPDHPYQHYRSSTEFVRRFVTQSVFSALKIIDNMEAPSDGNTREMGYFGNEWPTCGSFNPRNGEKSVIAEMKSWNSLPALKDWMFYVSFMRLTRKYSTEFYTYQVLWSVPTPAYPEPQVTVSVFFYVATSKIYPSHFPVDVTYCFEGHQFLHDLNIIFRPKWLYDILDMKTMMFKTFTF